ncbi:MAG TPA: outer membrane beta-barrel protein [Rhizomicrobium sp.]|nr:outer membrane beta-barrel protein [Rhizomicrobium sp.]
MPAWRYLCSRLALGNHGKNGAAAAILICVGALSAPALADDPINPQAMVRASGRYQAPGALPQGAGVLDRAKPEYDALGLPVGSFRLYPTFAAGASYDDNIFRDPGATSGDMFWTFSPRLDLRSQWQQDLLQVYAQADGYAYDSHSSENRANWLGGANSEFGIAPDTTVDARASYFDTHESRGSPDISTAALNPTEYSIFHTDLSVLNQPGPIGLSAGLSYDRYVYDPTPLTGGGMVDNSDRNARVLETYGKVSYEIEPGSSVFARASYNTRDFDLQFDRNGFQHRSDGYRLDGGLQMFLSPLIKGTMFLGYLQQNFKAPLQSVSGFDFGSQLDWYVTELVTVHLSTARILADTTIAGASNEDQRTIQTSVDYELLRNLILQARFGYENDIFDGATRRDHITSFGVGGNYLLDNRMSLYMRYDHSGRESTISGTNFSDNLLSAGITLQY